MIWQLVLAAWLYLLIRCVTIPQDSAQESRSDLGPRGNLFLAGCMGPRAVICGGIPCAPHTGLFLYWSSGCHCTQFLFSALTALTICVDQWTVIKANIFNSGQSSRLTFLIRRTLNGRVCSHWFPPWLSELERHVCRIWLIY